MMLTATKQADDLGNRTNVNVRDGNDITYTVDNLTNRYMNIADANLSYDAAGNLTKDQRGYEYEYDYENRIVKITKAGDDIAEFAYDALGRRVEKKDLIDPNNTRRYYYNYNLPRFVICGGWQVLCEFDGESSVKGWFVYGNYIDEVLAKGTGPSAITARFYIHDHLYSPVALTDYLGNVLERYEYDAYGSPAIWNADFTTERDSSNYGNPYLFTGRRVDILDSGSLKIQYNRNRYYDYYTGRWLTHDPIGYLDGLNLYEYVCNDPINFVDPHGFISSVAVGGKKALVILLSLQGFTVEEIATKVGLPIAVVIAILAADAIEIPSPSPPITKPAPIVEEPKPIVKPTPKPEPIPKKCPKPIPFCPMPAPAPKVVTKPSYTCPEERYKELVAKKKEACKKYSCQKQNLTVDEIHERIRNAIKCIRARRRIMVECFEGGDQKHKDLVKEVYVHYYYCLDRLKDLRRIGRSRRSRRLPDPRIWPRRRPIRINRGF